MFYVNVGHDHQLQRDLGANKGAILLPAHHYSERLLRDHALNCIDLLVDPQLYLATLEGEESAKACARLCTFPWFLVEGVPSREAGMTLPKWHSALIDFAREAWSGHIPEGEEVASKAIEYQSNLGCSILILPAPLLVDGTDDGEAIAKWLDWGLSAKKKLNLQQPALATIALDESILNEPAFEPHGLLDAIEDQVTARAGIAGVYILVNRSSAEHPFRVSANASRAYISLAQSFASFGLEHVLVNYADILGFVCMGVGASGFATGESHSRRRLSLQGFRDQEGRRLPRYYTHKAAGEFNTESDLDKLLELQLLRQIHDPTPFSMRLLEALEEGRSASDIVNWAENFSNDSFSRRHFLHRMMEATAEMATVSSLANRLSSTRQWLEDAHMRQLYIREKLDKVSHSLKGELAPVFRWFETIDVVNG